MNKDELLKKWLKNELSASEKQDFEKLDDADFNAYIVDFAKQFKASHHSGLSDFETLKQRYNKAQKPVKSLAWFSPLLKIASIVVVAFGIIYFTFLNDSETTLRTLANETNEVILPDNSKVSLNELSQLVYDTNQWDKKRLLQLNGEAFFDVEKGKTFEVKTTNGVVSVLGTEFNVISRDSLFKVSCYEGLVQVGYKNDTIKLPAGSEFTLVADNALTSKLIITEPHWLNHMSVFENANLSDVLLELERQYNIKVDNLTQNTIKFTGAFELNNIENALKSITQPLNLTYSIQTNNEVIIRNAQD
jgi:transmembrane sensor